jgi:hypothetical protein
VPVIPALGRLRLEDREFEASLIYIARPFIQEKKKKTIQKVTETLCIWGEKPETQKNVYLWQKEGDS